MKKYKAGIASKKLALYICIAIKSYSSLAQLVRAHDC